MDWQAIRSQPNRDSSIAGRKSIHWQPITRRVCRRTIAVATPKRKEQSTVTWLDHHVTLLLGFRLHIDIWINKYVAAAARDSELQEERRWIKEE